MRKVCEEWERVGDEGIRRELNSGKARFRKCSLKIENSGNRSRIDTSITMNVIRVSGRKSVRTQAITLKYFEKKIGIRWRRWKRENFAQTKREGHLLRMIQCMGRILYYKYYSNVLIVMLGIKSKIFNETDQMVTAQKVEKVLEEIKVEQATGWMEWIRSLLKLRSCAYGWKPR